MTKKALKALREKLNLSYKQTWLALTVLAALLTVLVLIVYNIDLIKIQGGESPVDRTIDYYGSYKTNAIKLTRHSENYIEENKTCSSVYYDIDGLKSADVQNIVNLDIRKYYDEHNNNELCIEFVPHANLYNVLSFEISLIDGKTGSETSSGVSYDLTSGNRLSFEDILTEDANKNTLIKNAYLTALEEHGNSSSNHEQAKKKAEDFANQYLKKADFNFFLDNDAITIIASNNETSEQYRISGADEIKYFAYLADYRTKESIYNDDNLSIDGLYLSGRYNYLLAEKVTYDDENAIIDLELSEYSNASRDGLYKLRDYLKDTYLSDNGFNVLQANIRYEEGTPGRRPSLFYFDDLIVCNLSDGYSKQDLQMMISDAKATQSNDGYNTTIDTLYPVCNHVLTSNDNIFAISKDMTIFQNASDFIDKRELVAFMEADPSFKQKNINIDDYECYMTVQGLLIFPSDEYIRKKQLTEEKLGDYILLYDWRHLDKKVFTVDLF